jgi:dTDP-4-amino-4,6-dideoxygalactose transaminase
MPNLALLGGTPVFDETHRWPAWPVTDARDEQRLLDVLRSGVWGIGSPVIAEFNKRLADSLGVKHALAVNSGTAALELAIKALGVGPGDEVIVPAYTFIASATCVLEMEGAVIFADIDPDTHNLSPASVARLITPRTKAIIAVHFGGNPADIPALERVVAQSGRKIPILEDAAHAHGMIYRGKPAGKHGIAAEFSYQSTKNVASGEGGALVTDNTELFELAESYHSFGRLPGRPWYEHASVSWNHRMSAFQAAVLLGQLDRLEEQTRVRFENGKLLNEALAQLPGTRPQRDTDASPDTRRSYHLYIWRHDAEATGVPRQRLLEALQAEGVPAFGGYLVPLQEQPMFTERRFWHRHRSGGSSASHSGNEPDYTRVQTPLAKALCGDAVWLAQSVLLADRAAMQRLVEAVAKVIENADELRDVTPVSAAAK